MSGRCIKVVGIAVILFTSTALTGFGEDLRRVLVNGCYWALRMEQQIPDEANVDYVDGYTPSFFGRNTFKTGLKPDDLQIKQ